MQLPAASAAAKEGRGTRWYKRLEYLLEEITKAVAREISLRCEMVHEEGVVDMVLVVMVIVKVGGGCDR